MIAKEGGRGEGKNEGMREGGKAEERGLVSGHSTHDCGRRGEGEKERMRE
jgi:hypothetical protein